MRRWIAAAACFMLFTPLGVNAATLTERPDGTLIVNLETGDDAAAIKDAIARALERASYRARESRKEQMRQQWEAADVATRAKIKNLLRCGAELCP